MDLKPRLSSDGTLESTEHGWKLSIPAGSAMRYRLAQLDDHLGLARSRYPYRPPVHMQLAARVSVAAHSGTWGFGLWNDPYGFSFGPGTGFIRLPALPNAVWFFYSSPISHLSFRDDMPANGFLAQVFSSPKFDPRLIRAALTFLFARRAARRLLARIISEDSAQLAGGATSALDVSAWHSYALDWTEDGTRFIVDDTCVLRTELSPRGPLGIVIWIDNQHAGYTPQGKVTMGLERNPEPAWMEIRDVRAG